MGLMPHEFWSLTANEFGIKHRAFARAENRTLRLLARHALMVAPHPKGMTPEKLLGLRGTWSLYPMRED